MKKLIKYVFSFVFVLLILSNSHNVHASVLINESFDGTTFPPTGWVKSSTSTLDWIRSTNTVHPSGGGTHSGAGLAYVNNWSTSSGTASLFTPPSSISVLDQITL